MTVVFGETQCRSCDTILLEENMFHSQAKRGQRICRKCMLKAAKARSALKPTPLAKKCDYSKQHRVKLRRQVFAAYGGPRCACCGEAHEEFLTLDHIGGWGAEHRAQHVGLSTYAVLRQQGWPHKDRLRVLCMNCNWATRQNGICPHVA